jgi:predicted N-acyltransferase
MAALVQGAVQLTDNNGLSSLHATFCTEAEARRAEDIGLMVRKSQQFHWRNDGFADFDAFLQTLNSRKRKNIRKERAQAQAFGGRIRTFSGDDLQPEHWDAFWRFYQDTGARKWGSPYLTRQFFDIAQERLRDDIALVLAEREGRWVAGALNFIGRDTLYGRYWGCTEHHPCLHFELCYYQAIDIAIARGLATVEAGAQGEHKLARGYLPTPTWSVHWMRDDGFARAVSEYLQAERNAVDQEIDILTEYGPFKRANVEEQQ